MGKNILVISTSLRKGGNSGTLADAFIRGAEEAGNQVEKVYLLATAAEKEESTVEGAVKGLSGWIACFPKAHFAGTMFGGGADAVGTIYGNPALDQAYEMGKAI